MKRRIFKTGLLALASLAMLWVAVGCDVNEDVNEKKATIQIKLTDAPALNYDEVNIDIQAVSVGIANGEGEWIDLNIHNPGVYNLLELRNGNTVLLAGGDIPAGDISQIRLLLGENNSVVVDGMEYDLDTPSAQQSGIKLNLHQTLLPGVAYSFVMDFDAARSVVARGNGTYGLKPVIRTYAEAFGGSIKGVALPARVDTAGVAYVQIVNDGDTLISIPEDDGFFLFAGLAPAMWDLTVVADEYTSYVDEVIDGIEVKAGEVVDLGVVELDVVE